MKHNILLVAKESSEYNELRQLLERYHFTVTQLCSSLDALQQLKSDHLYNMILLDINLADIYGIELCKLIRQINDHIPIVFISNITDTTEIVLCFEAGADDYIEAPYHSQILLARIKARLRTQSTPKEAPVTPTVQESELNITKFRCITFGAWTYHPHKCIIHHESHGEVYLTDKENVLLKLLLSNPANVFPREMIAKYLNLNNSSTITRDVNIHIHRLRNKLTQGKNTISPIKSVRSIGYTLDSYLDYSYDGQIYKFV